MPNDRLTEKQEDIFNFLVYHVNTFQRPPTIAEICKKFGFKSNQSAVDHLTALEKKGYIQKSKRARGINILKDHFQNNTYAILGKIAAGVPIDAACDEYERFDLANYYQSNDTYVLQVKGDSMINAGIHDGDLVFVKKQSILNNNDIGVIVIDEEATVKRFEMKNNKIILHPENDDYNDIIIDESVQNVRIEGKVVGLFRNLQ